MKKFLSWLPVILVGIVLLILIAEFLKEDKAPPVIAKKTDSQKTKKTYNTSGICLPCDNPTMIAQAWEIINDLKDDERFRGGRAESLSNGCSRYDCSKIFPLCYVYGAAAIQVEEGLLQTIGYHAKCDNDALDGRGKTPREGVPSILYIKKRKLSAEELEILQGISV